MQMKKLALCIGGLVVAMGASASLRVVSYSICHGEGADKVINIDRAGSLIARYNPDLVAIQEVDDNTTRSGRVDQTAGLGRRLGMAYRFKKSIDYCDGEFGIALLSVYPIRHTIFHNLPTLDGEEACGALEVVVDVVDEDGQTNALSFVCTLLGLNNDQRVVQVQALVRELSGRGHAVVVAGNLNATPQEEAVEKLLGAGFVVADDPMRNTFPAQDATQKNDYILTKDLPIRHRRCVVDGNPEISNHRLLFCEFLLGNGCAGSAEKEEAPAAEGRNLEDGKVLEKGSPLSSGGSAPSEKDTIRPLGDGVPKPGNEGEREPEEAQEDPHAHGDGLPEHIQTDSPR